MGADVLAHARERYAHGYWDEAYAALRDVRDRASLGTEDLAALADAAWWVGHNDEAMALCEEVFARRQEDGDTCAAARTAIEVGFMWLLRGELTVGSGWVNRATRLLADQPECPEHGYLLYLEAEQSEARGELEHMLDRAGRIQALGRRHDDATLTAIGLVTEGVARIRQGRVADGLGIVDEAMLPVHAGAVTPSWAGNLYCQLMGLFIELADIRRARAWTDATERWCARYPSAAMFRGICRVHRAELLHLEGDWAGAEQGAAQACDELANMNIEVVAAGHYELGELYRLRDDRDRAEAAYVRAGELGRDPQPGLALLRLAQGRPTTAAAALDAALAATDQPPARAPLLAARAEVAAACADAATATRTAHELTGIAEIFETAGLVAMARHGAGTAQLVADHPGRAVPLLRDACRYWRDLDARYDTARARVALAQALAAVGDREAADRERSLAIATFEALGAARDLRAARGDTPPTRPPGGLSDREVQVLALVARGETNRAIASRLQISERTVERHLSNVFLKLGVASRTEAARFAYAHELADPQR